MNSYGMGSSRLYRRMDIHYKPDMWAGDCIEHNYWLPQDIRGAYGFQLPKGSIKKLIGRDLSYDDEPVELKEE